MRSVWHSTGHRAEDGHREADCPGPQCPVVQLRGSEPEVPVMAQRTLTAQDRCDRCGAQAYVVTDCGGEMLWCAHHFREHEPKLKPFVVLDLTGALTAGK